MQRRYDNELVGYNMRMSELHAAIGRVQLRRLPGWTEQRRRNAARLTAGLTGLARAGHLGLPAVAPGAEPVWHQYTVRSGRRDELMARLADRGVRTGVYYPTPIHRLPAYGRACTYRGPRRPRPRCCRCRCTRAHAAQLEHMVRAVKEAVLP